MKNHASFDSQQIPLAATLDVQAVERELNELWMRSAGADRGDAEGAVLRARVLNLMVYVESERDLNEVDEMLLDVASVHPCRALVMLGDKDGADEDLQMHVASRCRMESGAGGRHLCCEQVTIRAGGSYAVELPSACLPLLIPDLPVFLWWRGAHNFEGKIFQTLSRASDRVIIDSSKCSDTYDHLRSLANLLQRQQKTELSLSDLNWSRLTTWRSLLAGFYDAPEHFEALARLSRVHIEYVVPEAESDTIAPKALLLAGWLASRLGWRVVSQKSQGGESGKQFFHMEQDGRSIAIEFRPSEHRAVAPGGLVRVELFAESEPQHTFVAMRAEDCRNLETLESSEAGEAHAKRVIVGGDRTEVEVISAELEIFCHDRIYEEAAVKAAEIIENQ